VQYRPVGGIRGPGGRPVLGGGVGGSILQPPVDFTELDYRGRFRPGLAGDAPGGRGTGPGRREV